MRPGGGGCPCFRVKSSYDRSATRGEGVLAVSQIIGNLSGSAQSVSWFLVFVTSLSSYLFWLRLLRSAKFNHPISATPSLPRASERLLRV